MIVRAHSKTGGAGDILNYLIINRESDQLRASRVADIAVHNLPVMPAIPKTPEQACELVKLLAQDMEGFTRNARLSAARPLRNRLLHIVASFDPNDTERLTGICGGPVAVARELALNVAGKDRAMILISHDDREHPHVHILISSADSRGRAWDSSFDRYRWNNGAREIERKYELLPLTFNPERHALSPTEHRRLEQCGIPDLLDRMRTAICAARADSPSRSLFERRLEKVGITVSERLDKEGKVRGWIFNYGEISIKGSAIDREFSYRNLTAGFNPERGAFDPRYEQGVRNVMLISMADEEKRREFIQHPRPAIRFMGMIAEEVRTGRVDRTWDEIGRAAQARLSASRQMMSVQPKFARTDYAELIPLVRERIRMREDQNRSDQYASRNRDSGRSGRSR